MEEAACVRATDRRDEEGALDEDEEEVDSGYMPPPPPPMTIAQAVEAAAHEAAEAAAAQRVHAEAQAEVEAEARLRRADAATSAARPMRSLRPLQDARAVVCTQLRRVGSAEAPSAALERACAAAVTACARGGNVLIPASPWSGTTLALVESILAILSAHRLPAVQLHLISPVGPSSCAHGEMLAEWLDIARNARIYTPSSPFDLETLHAARRLVFSPHCEQLSAPIQRPAIVVATHPSLRLGDAPSILHHWRHDPLSTLLLTTPCTDYELLLAPFAPMAIQVVRCPIEPRLNAAEAAALIGRLRPKQLVLPAPPLPPRDSSPTSIAPPDDVYAALSTSLNGRLPICRLAACEPLGVPTASSYEVAFMPMSAAMSVQMSEVEPGLNAGRFSGYLRYEERTRELRLLPDDWLEPWATAGDDEQRRISERVEAHRSFHEEDRRRYGTINAHTLVDDLRELGVESRVRGGDDDELVVVELLGEPYEREGFCIELRRGESMVVADCSDDAELPDNIEERLQLVQEVLEQQLVII